MRNDYVDTVREQGQVNPMRATEDSALHRFAGFKPLDHSQDPALLTTLDDL